MTNDQWKMKHAVCLRSQTEIPESAPARDERFGASRADTEHCHGDCDRWFHTSGGRGVAISTKAHALIAPTGVVVSAHGPERDRWNDGARARYVISSRGGTQRVGRRG